MWFSSWGQYSFTTYINLRRKPFRNPVEFHMYHSLNSLEGVLYGIILHMGSTIGVIKGHTRSLDNGSYKPYEAPIYSPYKPYRTLYLHSGFHFLFHYPQYIPYNPYRIPIIPVVSIFFSIIQYVGIPICPGNGKGGAAMSLDSDCRVGTQTSGRRNRSSKVWG